jgi:hypothetical protein
MSNLVKIQDREINRRSDVVSGDIYAPIFIID